MLKPRRPARFAVLCSHRAPGLDVLLRAPHYGDLFELALCFSTDESFSGTPELHWHEIPVVRRSIRRYYADHGARISDRAVRARYDFETARILERAEVDWVLLDSYLYVLSAPMLTAFQGRLLNVHDADLTLQAGGKPRYAGLHATRDAILGGETDTRATVHFVTAALDAGPPLLRSWPFPVLPGTTSHMRRRLYDAVRHYAAAHRDWVMERAWGVLLVRTAELLAAGRVDLRRGRAWIDGTPAPWDVREDGEWLARETGAAPDHRMRAALRVAHGGAS